MSITKYFKKDNGVIKKNELNNIKLSSDEEKKDTIVHQWIMILNGLESKGRKNWNSTDQLIFEMMVNYLSPLH